eukprot:s242_g3.t1
MSEYFRKLIRRDPPPAAHIRFRCAKLHRVSDGKENEYNTIYDVLKSRGWKETDDWHIFWTDKDWIHSAFDKMHLDPGWQAVSVRLLSYPASTLMTVEKPDSLASCIAG